MAGFIKLSIEIPIFLLFFAFMLCAPVMTNLVIYRTCYVTLGFNKTECALMGTEDADGATAELEKKVQPYANIIGMTRSIFDAITGCIVCIFLGSWSDRHGRRPVLLISLAGFTASYVFTTLFAFFEYATPWVLLATVFINLTGGIATFMSVALCYITDSTSEHDRGGRMGLLDASLMSGMLLGTLLSSFVFSAVGYVALFGICTSCLVVALLFTYFLIPESVQVQESENRLRDIVSTTHIKDTFKVVFKKREQNKQAILLLLITVMTLFVFVSNDAGILFLYLRSSFLWSLEKYTIFSAATGVYSIFATIFVVYLLHKALNISESILILAGLISVLNSALMIGVAKNNTHIYAAVIAKGPASGINPMIRTLMSKIVPPEEMGKLFSFFAPLEVLSAILILPLYTFVYNATIDILPSAYSFMSAGFAALAMVILAVVMHLQKRQSNDAHYRSVATNT